MKTTVSKINLSESKYGRLEKARKYARMKGWKPLQPEERKEFLQMVAECTNL
ncbi:MAG: hypothetical protein IJK87_15585 [Prevotella sp.]|nr:hypothetical protein [Prevotella sp.]